MTKFLFLLLGPPFVYIIKLFINSLSCIFKFKACIDERVKIEEAVKCFYFRKQCGKFEINFMHFNGIRKVLLR